MDYLLVEENWDCILVRKLDFNNMTIEENDEAKKFG